jgi:hypothetical protein
MLTRTLLAVSSPMHPCRGVALALALLGAPVIFAPAYAGGIEITNCFGAFRTFSCITQWGPRVDPNVREVPGPRDAQEEAEFIARDRKWVARCRPVIRQDQYGVGRYHYAAPGCEFGRLQD